MGLAALFGLNQSAAWQGFRLRAVGILQRRQQQQFVIGRLSSWPAEEPAAAVAVAVEEMGGREVTNRAAGSDTVRRTEPGPHQGPGTGQGTVRGRAQDPATVTVVGQKEKDAGTIQIRIY